MPQRTSERSISQGSKGLVTYSSAVDIDQAYFRVLRNVVHKKFGILENLLGYGAAQIRSEGTLYSVPALPTGFTLEKAFVEHTLSPADSDYVMLFGTKGGRDRFYVWPPLSAGVWQPGSDWLELTEAEEVTVSAVSSAASFTLSGLAQATANYYRSFWIWVYDTAGTTFRGADYVLANTSGGVMTTKFGVTGITVTDKVVIMRYPVFKKGATISNHFVVDDLPTVRKDGDNLTIFTGNNHSPDSGGDLWLGVVSNGAATINMFADSDFAFGNWWFTHAQTFRVPDDLAISGVIAGSAAADPMPWTSGSQYYILDVTGVYDDDQESRPRFDKYDNIGISNLPKAVEISAADQDIDLTLSLNVRTDLPRRSDILAGTAVGSTVNPLWDRRIKKLRVYIADATAVNVAGGHYQANTDHFFIREIDINDASWSLSGGSYTMTITLTGTEYRAAQEFAHYKVNGYQIQRSGANARFGVQVGNRAVIFPIYDDTKKSYRGIYSPIRYSGNAGVNVAPWGFRLDVTQYEGEINGGTEFQGKLVLFSPRRLMTAYVTGENRGQILESFQRKGLASYRTIKVVEGLLYFASQDSPLEIFDGSNFVSPSPGYFIKDIWDALTPAQKAASFAGYYHTGKLYVVKMGSRIFLYDVEQQIWAGEYETSVTFVDFIEGHDGQLYGATASTFVELFASTPTESLALTLESKVWNGQERDVVKARLQYKSDVTLKWIPVDDTQPSTLRENDPVLFLGQSNMESQDYPVSVKTTRFAVKLTSATSTDGNIEIEDLGFAETVKPEK